MNGDRPVLHRVPAAIHCNMAVNPLTLEAQVQGGMVMGLGTTLPGARITLKEGVVQQSNWHDYRIPTHAHVPPRVSVHVVPSADAPTGVGEPSVPPLAPALANAVATLTGKRYRSLLFTA